MIVDPDDEPSGGGGACDNEQRREDTDPKSRRARGKIIFFEKKTYYKMLYKNNMNPIAKDQAARRLACVVKGVYLIRALGARLSNAQKIENAYFLNSPDNRGVNSVSVRRCMVISTDDISEQV